ncbi:monooxygenase [Robbsia andropogonis]|uniref:Monooxygenase n=1 Tax=Robbsia andropogonis TaxID=28092 RepID=A0A0F5JW24_9BURK|nr:FAD-dependent oxidoreductase [Robbsia andropogonis]KKB61854.1 monooxygenase [Robbsia andropogonis]MCP1118651.1 FAD-dependent oxidoreductase [Robbsia andropogonis]MCP1128118.1 FAD-dependent oxidoreductase [Robbsia andropogonis]
MTPINKVLVIGGGIGGMCVAIMLRKQGIQVDLIEINPRWAADGAGITISGPSLRSLREIGVVDEVLRRGGSWRTVDICDANGKVNATVPVASAIGAEDLPGGAGIMRTVLADILGTATQNAGANVRLGLSFDRIEQDSSGVEVRFTDGSHRTYDLVIGADGLHSAVRKIVMPDFAGPSFTGQGSWRAVVPRLHQNSTIYMGETTKAGMNPISATECYLFVLDKRPGSEFVAPEEWPRMLADLLEQFGGAIGTFRAGLLDGSLNNPRVLYRPLAGHLIEAPWYKGRIVLLGDAIHATTPHLASGAGIAVEGAIVLAQELERHDAIEDALINYAERHYERARLVVRASNRMGVLEQQGGSREEHTSVMVEAQEALRQPLR